MKNLKRKLKLEDLRVQSFVTSLKEDEVKKLKGGTSYCICSTSSCETTDVSGCSSSSACSACHGDRPQCTG
ncbi:MAG: pinensin family lanthipeptide [Ignavibacteria bacterium]|nr:pinensin family lanthipeptide [Ignavibacteria bacterium]